MSIKRTDLLKLAAVGAALRVRECAQEIQRLQAFTRRGQRVDTTKPKPHWTQTPAGRKKMGKIVAARWAAKRKAASR